MGALAWSIPSPLPAVLHPPLIKLPSLPIAVVLLVPSPYPAI
jgi:hypothetical protein